MKKIACLLLAFTLFFTSAQGISVAGAEMKINDWPLMENAIKYEGEKNYDKAIYYFEELVKLRSAAIVRCPCTRPMLPTRTKSASPRAR